jgi:putative endonuclease
MKGPWYVYVLRCGDRSLYTGIARDVGKRLATHRAGRGSKYVRSRGAATLVLKERHPSRSAALKREYAIKHLRRSQKLALLKGTK